MSRGLAGEFSLTRWGDAKVEVVVAETLLTLKVIVYAAGLIIIIINSLQHKVPRMLLVFHFTIANDVVTPTLYFGPVVKNYVLKREVVEVFLCALSLLLLLIFLFIVLRLPHDVGCNGGHPVEKSFVVVDLVNTLLIACACGGVHYHLFCLICVHIYIGNTLIFSQFINITLLF